MHTTPKKFKEFVEQTLLPETGITKQKTISDSTTRRWLNVLGFFHQQQRQGVYYDGHEREDVVKYRKIFLEEMDKYEPYMASYEGETMDKMSREPIQNWLKIWFGSVYLGFYKNAKNQIAAHLVIVQSRAMYHWIRLDETRRMAKIEMAAIIAGSALVTNVNGGISHTSR
ncbi:hypothetical protein RhiirA4_431830 [Rhizophagus irregularis]|uniref:Uncharacterized protein n=1 Tax=Rhizophagus irregularis TaxID=588596 RepID=A0A2I1HRF1_9GLOM|nr:hypothetical protein RhiirA4_431830 [Rhizophagus irregularis]